MNNLENCSRLITNSTMLINRCYYFLRHAWRQSGKLRYFVEEMPSFQEYQWSQLLLTAMLWWCGEYLTLIKTRFSRWCRRRWNCKKKIEPRGCHLGFLGPSWIDNGYLISLSPIYGNNHLYQFWYFYPKVNDRYTNCHIYHFS